MATLKNRFDDFLWISGICGKGFFFIFQTDFPKNSTMTGESMKGRGFIFGLPISKIMIRKRGGSFRMRLKNPHLRIVLIDFLKGNVRLENGWPVISSIIFATWGAFTKHEEIGDITKANGLISSRNTDILPRNIWSSSLEYYGLITYNTII